MNELRPTNSNALMVTKPDTLPARSLHEELRLLISRFGADAVRSAVSKLTKKSSGRNEERDWQKLQDVLDQDATDYLDGKDPFKERSNYAISKAFADKNPGHSQAATHRRIMRKLQMKRRLYFMIQAWQFCLRDRPFGDYFRVVSDFATFDPKWGASMLKWSDNERGQLQRYRETIGEPDPAMTLPDIALELNKHTMLIASQQQSRPQGMFGSLPSRSLTTIKSD